jgi:hypothetical protein
MFSVFLLLSYAIQGLLGLGLFYCGITFKKKSLKRTEAAEMLSQNYFLLRVMSSLVLLFSRASKSV